MTNFGEKREGVATKAVAGVAGVATTEATKTSSSTTTTTYHTHPGVFYNDDELEAIARNYKSVMGYDINSTIGHFIKRCMVAGMEAGVVLDAIERTGWARNPSPYYMRAILKRYLSMDILRMCDVEADEQARDDLKEICKYDNDKAWFY